MLTAIVGLGVLASAVGISDEEFSSLPRLYHLDDYERCLSGRGLYCLGSFVVEPQSSGYSLLKEYSSDPLHFDHTYLHRGYCVSSRCPHTAPEPNTTQRFQLCAQHWGNQRKLHLKLQTLHYCRRRHDVKMEGDMTVPQLVFLMIVVVLLAMNAAGTAYDVMTGDDVKKNQMVVAWSVRENWRRLTSRRQHADPRLAAMAPLQGVRVVVLGTVMWTHAGFVQHLLFVLNPRDLSQMTSSWWMMPVKNGTALVQIFMMMSSFLLANNLLLLPKLNGLLPKLVMLRYIRLAPVHLLVVGFAASWWERLRGGPVWPAAVGAEAASCRRKFWTQALYINNLVEPEDTCLVQTWSLAVDMQLHLVAAALTLGLHRWRHRAVTILSVLLLASCVLNGALAYVFHWKTMLYIMTPENLRTMFRDEPSFWWWYTSPWGSLPACLIGLIMAHVHYNLQEQKVQPKDYRWLRWLYHLYFPLSLCWAFSGAWLLPHDSRLTVAIHAAIERPVMTLLSALVVFGVCNNFDGVVRDFFSWPGWRVLSRLSLPALMLHWSVNLLLVAAQPLPIPSSLLEMICDFISTWFLSYLLATPVSLLLELPAQRLAAALFSRSQQ